MCIEIRLKQSKIYSLQAEITSFNESGHFSQAEAIKFTRPLEEQVGKLQEEIKELEAREIDVVDEEALTPQKPNAEL